MMDLRRILSMIGRLVSLIGLFLAGRKIAQAVRKIRPQHSIHIVGPPAAGKTTLFRYLRNELLPGEQAKMVSRPRARIASDLSGTKTYFFLSIGTDDMVSEHTNYGEWLIKKYNPDGMIFITDTRNPTADQTYLNGLYNMYREFSTHQKKVKLRVLLILLNKFDIWGSTTEARDAMMNHYRSEVFQDMINRFHSSFGVTVQFGYTSLTQREHAPYNNLILKDFMMVLDRRG